MAPDVVASSGLTTRKACAMLLASGTSIAAYRANASSTKSRR
jgi:hypothetical protein